MKNKILLTAVVLSTISTQVFAADNDCTGLPTNALLLSSLKAVVVTGAGGTGTAKATGIGSAAGNGGLDFPMWATVVNQYGKVCAIATSGGSGSTQRAWPLSRVISAQKANTANALSTDTFAISTANLYSAVQPGGSLYGLQHSNPLNTLVGYRGDATTFGTPSDPMVGLRPGGVNVFGGGLALYSGGKLIGALGVSGDTSCADHNIAWAMRKQLTMDAVPSGVTNNTDNIQYPASVGTVPSGWQHPLCAAGLAAPN
ncbi:MAG: heme-binding protein [Methylophilaceae bacterium]|nr:heme-binding protein [Methylophilaceae bacterium]